MTVPYIVTYDGGKTIPVQISISEVNEECNYNEAYFESALFEHGKKKALELLPAGNYEFTSISLEKDAALV